MSEQEDLHITLREIRPHVSGEDYQRIKAGFHDGYEHAMAKRHNFNKRIAVLGFLAQAENHLRNASLKSTDKHEGPLNLGRGLGILMAIIDAALFRNQWEEHDTRHFKRELSRCIRHFEHEERKHRHPGMQAHVREMEEHKLMTPAEKELGDWLFNKLG